MPTNQQEQMGQQQLLLQLQSQHQAQLLYHLPHHPQDQQPGQLYEEEDKLAILTSTMDYQGKNQVKPLQKCV